jgi:hypothetical protein
MNITIKFENEAAARHFARWLCEQGEQDYWQWMEECEQEEKGNIAAVEFIYHKNDEFVPDAKIGTVLGRISR